MPFAPQISQFSDQSIPFAVAASLCGPAAAIAFARVNGRDPTLKEVQALAAEVGWTPSAGMAGPASEQALLHKLGVEADLQSAPDWSRVRADVQAGKPVIVSTPRHYFTVSDVDPASGKFYVGTSGTDLKGGSAWLSADEIATQGRGVNGVLHLSSAPSVPRERQQFLEANSPGESPTTTPGADPRLSADRAGPGVAGAASIPPTRQDARGAPSGERTADLPVSPAPPAPAPEAGPVGAPASNALLGDVFARSLLEQLRRTGSESPSVYRLPGAELPGFRPTRFQLPLGVN